MHNHLKDCIPDVGPLHSFWCFAFERCNGILEKMQMSWKAPEIQLIHKFSNLQALVTTQHMQTLPIELQECFVKMKQEKMAVPVAITDSSLVLKYESNTLCVADEVCAKKYAFQTPLSPRREKYFTEASRDALSNMYTAIYGKENVVKVPLRYEEFYQLQVLQSYFSSSKSRTSRSAAVLAARPSPCGILTGRRPTANDVRVGTIEFFISHKPTINEADDREGVHVTTPHLLAQVKWFQDHPQKYSLKNGVVLASAVYELTSFIPVSRIITQCASTYN